MIWPLAAQPRQGPGDSNAGRVTPHGRGRLYELLCGMKMFTPITSWQLSKQLIMVYDLTAMALMGGAFLFLLVSTGCVGYVDGGRYGGAVVVPGPDLFIFGGGYDRGSDVHGYSHRGYESRSDAHGHGGRR